MTLAGLEPCGVLCELTNEDGSMARLPQVAAFAPRARHARAQRGGYCRLAADKRLRTQQTRTRGLKMKGVYGAAFAAI